MTTDTMRMTFAQWPLGCSSYTEWVKTFGPMFEAWKGSEQPFDEWLREKVGKLLDTPAKAEYCTHVSRQWFGMYRGTVAGAIECTARVNRHLDRRVVLLDGTVVREWPAS